MRFRWQPADSRRKAAKYSEKARSASSYDRCQKYSELASLYLAYAEMRDREIAARAASKGRSNAKLSPG
jgi:hypothetical protein